MGSVLKNNANKGRRGPRRATPEDDPAAASVAGPETPASDERPVVPHQTPHEPVFASPPAGDTHPTSAPIDDVLINPFNSRTVIGDLTKMVESMKERGQIEAITVVTAAAFLRLFVPYYPELDLVTMVGQRRFVAVTGERRLTAAPQAGLTEIKFIVDDAHAESVSAWVEVTLAENLHHNQLDAIDEAFGIAHLVEELRREHAEAPQKTVAIRFGKSQTWVSQTSALVRLVPELQSAVRAKTMPLEQARKIAALPAEQQIKQWEQVVKELRQRSTDTAAAATAQVTSLIRSVRKKNVDPAVLGSAWRQALTDEEASAFLSAFHSGTAGS